MNAAELEAARMLLALMGITPEQLTNLPDTITASEILRRYKGQEVVERRYSTVKGPLAVAPMFLKNNRRIAALITVICLALLIFCLIERRVRQAIAPQATLEDLYVGRPANPPDGSSSKP